MEITHDAEVGELEDRSVLVLVDGEDVLRRLHADLVLDRARHAESDVELRGDGLAGLADLARVREPAGVDDGAGGTNGAAGAEGGGEVVGDREVLGRAEAAATVTRICASSMLMSAPRCSPRTLR